MMFYILAFLVLLGNYYISYFFTGMTAFLVYDYLKTVMPPCQRHGQPQRKCIAYILSGNNFRYRQYHIRVLRAGREGQKSRRRFFRHDPGFHRKSLDRCDLLHNPCNSDRRQDLGGAVERATHIIKRNLLPIGVVK